ncbi:MAG TPA: hydroxymethylglutaryl-CoA lyase [Rhodospirillaceae bacterium]|nr:hydroxymethylglutaryl-CoA lyase [Rhodospirillaceae bacterium]
MSRPTSVRLVEVGPRDGLQNEPKPVPLAVKIELIERLAEAGLTSVEVGAFVSPKRVPQMADSAELLGRLNKRPGVSYPVLTPNPQGLEAAIAAGAAEVAIFAAASEGFSRNNINCSLAESLERNRPVAKAALDHGLRVRGYVSTVIACPFDGPTAPAKAAEMAERLFDMGCYEISMGDTIGAGTADQVRRLIEATAVKIPRDKLAMHFHDTYGQAVANILVSLEEGIAVFDSSVAGLGGCPFAPGASGNVATEDVLYLLKGLGIPTGVDLPAVAAIGQWIAGQLGRPNGSRAGRAIAGQG